MFECPAQGDGRDKKHARQYGADVAPLPTQVVVEELRSRLPGLDTLKLHKLLYYCQGHHLAAFDQKLFNDSISAFDNGPVVSHHWWAEKNGEPQHPGDRKLTEAELNTIGYVVSRYGHLSGAALVRETHSEMPWQRADESRPPGGSARIQEEWIRSHFLSAAIRDDPAALRRSPLAQEMVAEASGRSALSSEDLDDPAALHKKLSDLRSSIR